MGNDYTDIKAFLDGYKPSFLFNHNKPKPWFYDDDEVNKLSLFPSVDGLPVHTLDGLSLYFQNVGFKNWFISSLQQLVLNSPEYHELLGIALGYPPLAARFYKDLLLSDDPKDTVGIHFFGMGCRSDVSELEENILWLWETYPLHWFQKPVEINYTSVHHPVGAWYEIPYKDRAILKHVQDELQQKSQIPA